MTYQTVTIPPIKVKKSLLVLKIKIEINASESGFFFFYKYNVNHLIIIITVTIINHYNPNIKNLPMKEYREYTKYHFSSCKIMLFFFYKVDNCISLPLSFNNKHSHVYTTIQHFSEIKI